MALKKKLLLFRFCCIYLLFYFFFLLANCRADPTESPYGVNDVTTPMHLLHLSAPPPAFSSSISTTTTTTTTSPTTTSTPPSSPPDSSTLSQPSVEDVDDEEFSRNEDDESNASISTDPLSFSPNVSYTSHFSSSLPAYSFPALFGGFSNTNDNNNNNNNNNVTNRMAVALAAELLRIFEQSTCNARYLNTCTLTKNNTYVDSENYTSQVTLEAGEDGGEGTIAYQTLNTPLTMMKECDLYFYGCWLCECRNDHDLHCVPNLQSETCTGGLPATASNSRQNNTNSNNNDTSLDFQIDASVYELIETIKHRRTAPFCCLRTKNKEVAGKQEGKKEEKREENEKEEEKKKEENEKEEEEVLSSETQAVRQSEEKKEDEEEENASEEKQEEKEEDGEQQSTNNARNITNGGGKATDFPSPLISPTPPPSLPFSTSPSIDCPTECDVKENFVCASDNVTYVNECFVIANNCIFNTNLSILHSGVCGEDNNENHIPQNTHNTPQNNIRENQENNHTQNKTLRGTHEGNDKNEELEEENEEEGIVNGAALASTAISTSITTITNTNTNNVNSNNINANRVIPNDNLSSTLRDEEEQKRKTNAQTLRREEQETRDDGRKCLPNCEVYFDGCNTCLCDENDNILSCTQRRCFFAAGRPNCLQERAPPSCMDGCFETFDGCQVCSCDEQKNLLSCQKFSCKEKLSKPTCVFNIGDDRRRYVRDEIAYQQLPAPQRYYELLRVYPKTCKLYFDGCVICSANDKGYADKCKNSMDPCNTKDNIPACLSYSSEEAAAVTFGPSDSVTMPTIEEIAEKYRICPKSCEVFDDGCKICVCTPDGFVQQCTPNYVACTNDNLNPNNFVCLKASPS